MNNQNPYTQNPYDQQAQQPYQPPYQPPMPAPQPKKASSLKMNDLMPILACSCSITGLVLFFVYTTMPYDLTVFGTIVNIIALLLSAGGCFLSFMLGQQNIKAGKERGKLETLGLVLGIVGLLVGIFAMFATSCNTCNYCKAQNAKKEAEDLASAAKSALSRIS